MYEGKRVRLRAFENGDLMPALQYNNDFATMKGASAGMLLPSTEEDEARFMAKQTSYTGGEYQFAIETLSERLFIGQCGFIKVNWRSRFAEIAIIIGNEADRGKGYGEDAVNLLCRIAFEEMNLHKLKASVFDFNGAAVRCYRKCGFREEGRLKDELFRCGKYCDVILMAKFNTEEEK